MSRSESTTKARHARRIERQRIDAITGRGSDRLNQLEADLAALGSAAGATETSGAPWRWRRSTTAAASGAR